MSVKSPHRCCWCHGPTGNKSGICGTCWDLSAVLRENTDRGAQAWAVRKRAEMGKGPSEAKKLSGQKLAASNFADSINKSTPYTGFSGSG